MRVSKKVLVLILLLLITSLVFVEIASSGGSKRKTRTRVVTCVCQPVAPANCCDRAHDGICYNVTENNIITVRGQQELRAGRCAAYKTCFWSGTNVVC